MAGGAASVKPYYERGGIVIYHGDCREVLPTLERGSADLVLTDPPYNAGKHYGQHDDNMSREAYTAWCREWFEMVRAVCARTVVFPGHGNLPVWWEISKPSAVGCWYKPGNPASSHLGWAEWEPYLYWGQRMGGSSVVRAPVTAQRDIGDHPCPKPLQLMLALLVKTKARAVLDPFLGSGTTALAAKVLGIPCIGIEIEERWCEVAANRLGQDVLPLEVV